MPFQQVSDHHPDREQYGKHRECRARMPSQLVTHHTRDSSQEGSREERHRSTCRLPARRMPYLSHAPPDLLP